MKKAPITFLDVNAIDSHAIMKLHTTRKIVAGIIDKKRLRDLCGMIVMDTESDICSPGATKPGSGEREATQSCEDDKIYGD